jgi:hypothetical protein
MDDTQHHDDFPPLTIDQIRDLAEAIREVFGGKFSRADFTDRLLMFLEDVPGCESGEVAGALIESAWAEYADPRP